MRKLINLTGQKFNRLKVVGRARKEGEAKYWAQYNPNISQAFA